MEKHSRPLKVTDDEFLLIIDEAGGLVNATIFGGYSAKDLRDQGTPLHKAMKAWDTWVRRGKVLEAEVIKAALENARIAEERRNNR